MTFKEIIATSFILIFLAISPNFSTAQSESPAEKINPQDTIPISLADKRFNEKYQKNIKKSRINGVYIPKDLDDAFQEIKELSKKESLDKFKQQDADFVVKRLHFGLGRWMILNWNFYEGSRISHHIKSYGVTHPDDQARFLLFALHNHLNDKDLDLANIANRLIKERQAIIKERKASLEQDQ